MPLCKPIRPIFISTQCRAFPVKERFCGKFVVLCLWFVLVVGGGWVLVGSCLQKTPKNRNPTGILHRNSTQNFAPKWGRNLFHQFHWWSEPCHDTLAPRHGNDGPTMGLIWGCTLNFGELRVEWGAYYDRESIGMSFHPAIQKSNFAPIFAPILA